MKDANQRRIEIGPGLTVDPDGIAYLRVGLTPVKGNGIPIGEVAASLFVIPRSWHYVTLVETRFAGLAPAVGDLVPQLVRVDLYGPKFAFTDEDR